MANKRLVCGVGINDADYKVKIKETIGYTEDGKQIQKLIWICPFYSRWSNMLKRCYNEAFLNKSPTYKGCYTVPEWHYFMNFRAWMETQDWEDKELDKDLLFPGNKIYGPETCVFVSRKVNRFLTESTASRGEWPIGVYFRKDLKKYLAQSNDFLTGKRIGLGCFETVKEAHETWLTFKLEKAKILASQQSDPRVAKALIERYENYEI